MTPTDFVALATFTLAIVTTAAILAPIVQSNCEHHRRKIAVLARTELTIRVFKQRVDTILQDINRNAAIHQSIMETLYVRALEDDLGYALQSDDDADTVYTAMVSAYTAMEYRSDPTMLLAIVKDELQSATDMLDKAENLVDQQIATLRRRSWILVWLGR